MPASAIQVKRRRRRPLNSAVAAYYYLRILVMLYMHEPGEAAGQTEPTRHASLRRSHHRHHRDEAHCELRTDNRKDSDGCDCSPPVQFAVGTRSMWSITNTSTCCLRDSSLNPRESRMAVKMSAVGASGGRSGESGCVAA